MRALRTFRENSARFEDVRAAFVAAIEEALAAKVAEVEREIERRAPFRTQCAPRINPAGVLAIAFMAASAFLTGAGLFVIARTLGVC
jgi:hypothetical protein